MSKEFMSSKDVAAYFNISQSTVWRWVRSDLLPKPINITSHCVRWPASVIHQHGRDIERARSDGEK